MQPGVKPLLFLGIRAQDAVADDEYAAVLRCTDLPESGVRRLRIERDLPELAADVDLSDWSAIVLGGGPWCVSDPEATKDGSQRRGEAWLHELVQRVVDADFPFLGACYGTGSLGVLAGGVVDHTYAEPVGAVRVTLTDAGRADPLLGSLAESFWAFVGHQEAVTRLPRGAVRLAGSPTCPVQAFRLGEHVYATQFHPELDIAGLVTRIETYRDFGYYAPSEGEELVRLARAAVVTEPARLLAGFAARYVQGRRG